MSATEELYRSYLDLRWTFDPSAASAAGVTSQDARLGVYDAASVKTHLAAFKSMAGAVELLEIDDTAEEIDRTAFLDEIRTLIFRFENERPHIHNPGFWLSHLLNGLQALLRRRSGAQAERAGALLGRLGSARGFLDAARETLKDPPRVFLDSTLAMVDGGRALLTQAAERARFDAPTLTESIDAALGEAEAGLDRFRLALKSELRAHPDDQSFATGEEQFNRRLHHEHALQAEAPELYRYGLHLVEEVGQEVVALARSIDPSASWRDVVERLRETAPAAGDLVGAFRSEMERARRFVEARGLVTVPDAALEVVETPPFLRPVMPFAAYDPPGVYGADRTGTFYVTTDDAKHHRAPEFSSYELSATALHEAYPGHHLQFTTAIALPSEIRRNVWTPVTGEGWALYCEEMMGEAGFFTRPEERLFQRLHLLWRAVRIVLDVGLHTRGMTPDQATDYLVDHLAMDRRRAEAEVSRYCAWPTYQLCYAVGRREILHLRDNYRERAGADFNLRQFHDEFLSYGGLPVSLIRWGMGLGIDEG